jgi:2-isopropylmalate synthase
LQLASTLNSSVHLHFSLHYGSLQTNYVRIFDTSLRDGEQAPGASMTSAEKLEVARALARLGVDVIEAGFPAASPDDLAAVQAIAAEIGQTPIEGARSPSRRSSAASRAHQERHRRRLGGRQGRQAPAHPHLPRDQRDPPQAQAPHVARGDDRQGRRDGRLRPLAVPGRRVLARGRRPQRPEFLYKVLAAVIKAGATTLNIPDTVGYTMPDEFGALIAGIMSTRRARRT